MALPNQVTSIKGLKVSLQAVGGTSVLFDCLNGFKPMGIQSGGKVKTTGSCNAVWNTYEAGDFADATAFQFTGKYTNAQMNLAKSIINKKCQLTVTFPNGKTHSAWVQLSKFDPENFAAGASDSMGFSAECEALNSDSSGAESGPSYSS